MVKEINLRKQGLLAWHIACLPGTELLATAGSMMPYIIDSTTDAKSKALPLKTTEKEPEKQIHSVNALVSAPNNTEESKPNKKYVFVLDNKRFVKVFHFDDEPEKIKYLHCFSTLKPDEDQNTKVNLWCAAIDRNGQLLVSDWSRELITIHSCPDGELVAKVKCPFIRQVSMAVNSKNQILQHFRPADSKFSMVAAIDYLGNEVFSFSPTIDESFTHEGVEPCGIECDQDDNIYIAMCVQRTSKTQGQTDRTGHIHAYSPTGGFLKCIAKDRYFRDLSMTSQGEQLLAAACSQSILLYKLRY